MKSYLLPAADAAVRATLQTAGVKFFDWKDGIIFEGEADLAAALAALRLTAVETATEYANLVSLKVKPVAQPVKPTDSARAVSREKYIEACRGRLGAMLEAARDTAAKAGENLPTLRANYFAAVRADFVKQHAGDMRAFLSEQLNALRTTGGVRAVQCLPGLVLVDTETLHTTKSNGSSGGARKVELGRFRLEINLDGSRGGMRFLNSTRLVKGFEDAMHAPNVFANGRPCFDELEQVILELIARFELASAVEIAIQFLESSGEDPFLGLFAERWPEAA